MVENEGFIIFIYDYDSLFLDKSMSKYPHTINNYTKPYHNPENVIFDQKHYNLKYYKNIFL